MRKSTKRVISSLLAASMLFTSVLVNPTYAYADSSSAVVSTYASSLSFDYTTLTASADKEALTQNEVSDFTVSGTVTKRYSADSQAVTAVEVAKNFGGTFSFAAEAGDKVSVLFSSTGGSNTSEISINTAADGSGQELAKASATGTASGAETLEYTFTEAGTYYIGSPTNDDLKRGARIYTITVGEGSEESSTEVTTVEESSTEATTVEESSTEATTASVENSTSADTTEEASTEATTEGEEVVIGSNYKFVAGDVQKAAGTATGSAAYAKGAAIDVDPAVEVTAFQRLNFTLKNPPEISQFENGNVYDSWIASDGENASVSVDGAEPVNYRVAFTMTALEDCSILVDAKVGAGKTVVLGYTDDNAATVTSIENVTSEAGELHTFAADLKAGETIAFLGKGTNPPIYAIDVQSESEGDAEWKVVFEKLIDEAGLAQDAKFAGANDVIFEDDEIAVTACQRLNVSKIEETSFPNSGNTYTKWVASDSEQVTVSVDGAEPGAYRKVVQVEAKADGTLYFDAKVNKDKTALIATGDDSEGYTSLELVAPVEDTDFHTFETPVKKGDKITFIGKGTNPPLFGINFVADAAAEGFTILVGQNEVAEYDIDANKTTESISFYTLNNPGFNNFTVFVKYDPTLLKATSGTWGDLLADVEGFKESADRINQQIANVPSANNTDYAEVGADGVKTQAELGLVKIAGFSKDASTDYVVDGDGCLFTIDFEILQTVTEKTDTGLTLVIVQDGFRPGLGSSDIIDTEVENDVYLVPSDESTSTTESTTESTSETESESASETETESETESATETSTESATETSTEAVTETETEASTEASTEVTTEEESASVETTIVVVTRKTHGGGGGGGSSSSLTKSSTTTTESSVEPTTSSRNTDLGEGSFTVTGKNNQPVVIKPPTATKSVDDFTDVPKSHWAYDSIMKLAELGIVNGVGDNMYAPSAPCKRADFIIMINNTLGITGTAKFNFSDVAANKYYYNPVGVAYEIGIASGYGDDTFKPENYCTREEMMVLVAKTFEFLGETVTTTSQDNLSVFADRDDISWWAAPYTAYLVEEGMVKGTGANFEPKVYMNRAQLAVLIAQVYDKVVAMAEEKGVSAEEVVDEIVDEATEEELTTADVVKLAEHVKGDIEEIDADYYADLDKDIQANYDARKAEFEELYATISEDMSEDDAAKANVSLKEFEELFEDIIAEAE